MQIAQVMGGYSLGAADLLRRAMGKKIASEMDAQRKIFVDGAIKNNVDKAKASGIFDLVAKFAGYGFNKSHAAAYAMISYQTAYLKAHYPVEFLAASMNLEIQDTDKIGTFCQEARAQKITILPPDINYSGAYFKPEKLENGELAIRYGLGALKNVGINAMQHMEQKRGNDKFSDLFDFAGKLDNSIINKRQMESLIKAGAFDFAHTNRKQIFEIIEQLLRYSAVVNEEKNSSQSSLFGDASGISTPKPKLPDTEDWPNLERINNQFDAIGLYLGQHPLSSYEKILKKMQVKSFATLEEELAEGSSLIKIAGVVISKKIRSSPRGRFANISLSDPSGIFEVSIFNEDLLSSARDLLENGTILLLSVEARKDGGGVRMIADSIADLNDAMDKYHLSLKIHIDDVKAIEQLRYLLNGQNKGKARISMITTARSHKVTIDLPGTYPVNMANIDDIREIDGVKAVEEV